MCNASGLLRPFGTSSQVQACLCPHTVTHIEYGAMQEARRRQKELEQVERQNAAAATAGPGPQATPHFPVPSARPHSARSARFAEGVHDFIA